MATTQQNHDPALAHVGAPTGPQAPPPGPPPSGGASELSNLLSPNLSSPQQVMELLRKLPGFTTTSQGELTRDSASAAAETLSNLSQGGYQGQPHLQHLPHPHPHAAYHHVVHPQQHSGLPSDPGPSSHPRGPPNLGQLSAAATALQAPGAPSSGQTSAMRTRSHDGEADGEEPNGAGAGAGMDGDANLDDEDKGGNGSKTAGGRRGGRSATMSNDEWTRQRKDNHKEVERRRRGNINEGINELGRIVPNGSGEKAKGAILSRAVQYIHHLKENEARNIEKWTLEKLLMDQAMGDLQAQLEEMRRVWEDERVARQRAESELDVLRGIQQGLPLGASAAAAVAAAVANAQNANNNAAATKPAEQPRSPQGPAGKETGKRDRAEDGILANEAVDDAAERAKRLRVE